MSDKKSEIRGLKADFVIIDESVPTPTPLRGYYKIGTMLDDVGFFEPRFAEPLKIGEVRLFEINGMAPLKAATKVKKKHK